MKIVVLDGYTANPGDLTWEEFTRLGEFQVYDRTPPEQVVPRAAGAEAVLTNKTVIARHAISALPALRYIGVLATGYNIIDTVAARERGIVVCNVPEYSTANVAQTAFALLLELTDHAGHHAETVRAGKWSGSVDFCYWDFPLIELSGLTLGIIGYGRIGRAVARIAQAFGMRVLAYSRLPASGNANGVEPVELDILLQQSDVVSLHCPLTAETTRMVNAAMIDKMKHSAFLINTSRGGLIDEASLAAALNSDRLAGAGLDVLSTEPPRVDNPLLTAKNCIITPHIAWASQKSRSALLRIAAENLRAWQKGARQNVVN
jgi:glycerate dehydrogenase